MSLVISIILPIIKMIIELLFELKEKNNEAIEAVDITDGAGRELFSRELM